MLPVSPSSQSLGMAEGDKSGDTFVEDTSAPVDNMDKEAVLVVQGMEDSH